MEIPIRIIITLFVALIVGIGVIGFSQTVIKDSRSKVASFNMNEVDMTERIIEVDEITSVMLAGLAETCFNDNSNKNLEDGVCFVVFGRVDASESRIEDHVTSIDEDDMEIDLSDADNAVRVKYDAIENKVIITG